jgi:hypothetical protein
MTQIPSKLLDCIDELDAADDLLQALLLLVAAHVEKAYSTPLCAVLAEAQNHVLKARNMFE